MLKKQYHLGGWNSTLVNPSHKYFDNFIKSISPRQIYATGGSYDLIINQHLSEYDAELAKSKSQFKYNVKFNDEHLYFMFVLKWS